MALLEAPIDALSLTAIEHMRADTLYAGTGCDMGPGTLDALRTILARLRKVAGMLVVVVATDASTAEDRYAAQHAALAADAAVSFERLRPPEAQDRNDVLVRGGHEAGTRLSQVGVQLPAGEY